MSLEISDSPPPIRASFAGQLIAWLAGLAACLAGMLNLVAEWNMEQATIQFLCLVFAPVAWMIHSRRPPEASSPPAADRRMAWVFAILVAITSLLVCYRVGSDMVDLPPAYHDEYSYLFQAQTLLLGKFSVPTHPAIPELFDQMHVLNEGRMASRYYPGTGFWLAPFVALNHPYWGQWLATTIASLFVFWAGYELGGLRVAIVSGFAFALSPGIALFSNLLLAHQATLLGLSVFLWSFTRWQRTLGLWEAFLAGCGLSFAMLCRPATAAGFGLPFGIALFWWLFNGKSHGEPISWARRLRALAAIGLPVVAGWAVMIAYNESVTGSWSTSPYQLYTDIYTPRHVYGFHNVERGAQKAGPKTLENYDRWAKNLTPELAMTNLCDRWFASWLWTFDVLPLLISLIIVAATFWKIDRRWRLIGAAILSLHAIHIPYWYTGIMGWHYVFETAPLWCLLLGQSTDLLIRAWRQSGRYVMPVWWSLLLLVSLAGDYVPFRIFIHASTQIPRIIPGISSIHFPRNDYAEFDRWLDQSITRRPAIVLIEVDPNNTHIDYVTNTPDLNSPILRGRWIKGQTDVQQVMEAFPDRTVYLCQPSRKIIRLAQ